VSPIQPTSVSAYHAVHTLSDSRTAKVFVSEGSEGVKTATLSFKLNHMLLVHSLPDNHLPPPSHCCPQSEASVYFCTMSIICGVSQRTDPFEPTRFFNAFYRVPATPTLSGAGSQRPCWYVVRPSQHDAAGHSPPSPATPPHCLTLYFGCEIDKYVG
jgi:hypothetical protein